MKNGIYEVACEPLNNGYTRIYRNDTHKIVFECTKHRVLESEKDLKYKYPEQFFDDFMINENTDKEVFYFRTRGQSDSFNVRVIIENQKNMY